MIVFTPRWWFYSASCIGPIIVIRERDYSKELLNHEYIHYMQQRELLFVFAYIIYVAEFIVKLLWYRNITKAYVSISFEREAFGFQNIIGYCGHRKPYSWRHLVYVTKKKEYDGLVTIKSKKDGSTISN